MPESEFLFMLENEFGGDDAVYIAEYTTGMPIEEILKYKDIVITSYFAIKYNLEPWTTYKDAIELISTYWRKYLPKKRTVLIEKVI